MTWSKGSRRWNRLTGALGLWMAVSAVAVRAESVEIPAAKDNTLYEEFATPLSNGAGSYFFIGTTGNNAGGRLRRALIAFDVAAMLPAGATIESVRLRLHLSRTISADQPLTLSRVQTDWGEGNSDAPGVEGGGAPAEPGDATWVHRFFDTVDWTRPGGDFAAQISGQGVVGFEGFYEIGSAARMAGDVQDWLDAPETNFGWLIRGNEDVLFTAKRFDSRENPIEANRPALIVQYTPPPNRAGGWERYR